MSEEEKTSSGGMTEQELAERAQAKLRGDSARAERMLVEGAVAFFKANPSIGEYVATLNDGTKIRITKRKQSGRRR